MGFFMYCIDLLTRIFVCENKRLNIKDILNHDYVKKAPRTLFNVVKSKNHKTIAKRVTMTDDNGEKSTLA